jgi:hypothetical protein
MWYSGIVALLLGCGHSLMPDVERWTSLVIARGFLPVFWKGGEVGLVSP